MINSLSSNIVIENVIQSKMRGRVMYQGCVSSHIAINFSYSKPYNNSDGKGYQRPTNQRRCQEFAEYLSEGEDSLFTPILLNAAGYWEFHSYDKKHSNYGRLICKKKASLMDGQHRLGGIKNYVERTDSVINVPFLVFHYLDDDEEIKLFDVINTKAKGIGTSLSRYLNRNNDEISWVATNLILKSESPFFNKGTLIGKRTKEKHITLQNIYQIIKLLTKKSNLEKLSKEKILNITLLYYKVISEILPEEWKDHKNYRISHVTCLNSLAIVGNGLINEYFSTKSNQVDSQKLTDRLANLTLIDWSTKGDLKYVKGVAGIKMLAEDILYCLDNN